MGQYGTVIIVANKEQSYVLPIFTFAFNLVQLLLLLVAVPGLGLVCKVKIL